MGIRHEVIANTLQDRYHEVCARFANTSIDLPNADSSTTFQHFRKTINNPSPPQLNKPTAWLDCEFDCLTSLAMLASGANMLDTGSNPPDPNEFLADLKKTAREPVERFSLLLKRYRQPLNIALSSEASICEHLLERLMVADRARAEQQSIDALYEPDVLLKLNLVAIKSALGNDLRFIDALNYFYELFPSGWRPKSEYAWLFLSYLIFYARALEVCSCQIEDYA